ncbi:Crp/Fnr family transcriptional regulator [Chryseobacterium sp. L7]|uniref:Crp/Fnr family transcriptional regulator n=1 Tax=Chryseobacterium endalhagicum TaxID=2797638 RepID=A0ABS1QK60_9FLAO|nr:Crp/Fnr family transcriptional regulator [Chryseobacterium endalhagicum]MBL1223010.1 Crp/Fnr family transcriptional regulator [Chryseobacterium endalhagicum]
MKYNEFIETYFDQNKFLNDRDKEKLTEMVQIINYPANKIIMHRGEPMKQVGIVAEGLIRAYDKNNKTVWLFSENSTYGSMETLTLNRPSSLTFETLEETSLFMFNYNDLENTIRDYPNITALLLALWKKTAMDIYVKFYSFLHLTPEKRYLQLLQQNSKLILRVKSKDLATYLGMHPVSLSRLKKRYFIQNK